MKTGEVSLLATSRSGAAFGVTPAFVPIPRPVLRAMSRSRVGSFDAAYSGSQDLISSPRGFRVIGATCGITRVFIASLLTR